MTDRDILPLPDLSRVAGLLVRRVRDSSHGRQEHKNIGLLSWVSFLVSFKLYTAVAIIYFAHISHSYTLGLSIFSIIQITQAVLDIPTGTYSDRLGRRTCAIIGALASLMSVTLYAIGHSYLILAAGAVCEGASLAFYSGNNDALLYETLVATGHAERYHNVLGKVRSLPELAWLLAGVLGSVTASWSFPLLMWLSVVPHALATILSFHVVEPPIHRGRAGTAFSHVAEALSLFKTNPQLRRLSVASILAYGISESAFQFQPVFYNMLLPLWATGWIFSLNSLFSTISYRLSGRIIAKLKALNLLVYQEVYSRSITIIALAFPTALSPVLMAFSSVLFGPGEVAKTMLFQHDFTDRQRATMASIISTLRSALYAVVALLIGVAADRLGPTTTLLLAQVFLLPVLWLYVRALQATRERRRDRNDGTRRGR